MKEYQPGEAVCKHRERQATILKVLRDHEGSMKMLDLLDLLVSDRYNFYEGEAIMALLDSPPEDLTVDHFNGVVAIRERQAA